MVSQVQGVYYQRPQTHHLHEVCRISWAMQSNELGARSAAGNAKEDLQGGVDSVAVGHHVPSVGMEVARRPALPETRAYSYSSLGPRAQDRMSTVCGP